ncbi:MULTISPECIES: class I SAM-dependent methyltransferase [unclassified Leptolyngbya]|uniref:class I SAM-dependent methyltransferase n=1 Tax=unclassified Leptolyngbya TaxID=2650499 RepID=UPI001684AF53|nr:MULTISPECIES: class I SAM-dependent methyltransferase [unclassified Leptolyngbya]MBD1909403.1 methyltransferase domain-containing protein [Leptolyngbya sp. FACHB-8]MBD2157120.1 methyltransferase domain-containing protein [Leptolyngbya sp. FACHB-16]
MLQGLFSSNLLQSLIEQDPLQWYKSRDWQKESDRFRHPGISYPTYYKDQNFHSIKNGYLSVEAAVSYDLVSPCLLLPNEQLVRRTLINKIREKPQHILDLGCGTGSMTLLLKQAFPSAKVIGLDLSPYMLVMAATKAQQEGADIQFLQGNAEKTQFPDCSFDLITASLLFHETPSTTARTILQESYRLLKPGGKIAIMDGNQLFLRRVNWVNPIFEEPYAAEYADGDMTAWLQSSGFAHVHTQSVWWMHQVSYGVKLD